MTDSAVPSTDQIGHRDFISSPAVNGTAEGWKFSALLVALFLVSVASQIERMLPFALSESINRDLSFSDTQMGLLTGIAFAVCYTLLSMPLARASDRGPPRLVLVLCILLWSAMTALGGLAASFLFLAVRPNRAVATPEI